MFLHQKGTNFQKDTRYSVCLCELMEMDWHTCRIGTQNGPCTQIDQPNCWCLPSWSINNRSIGTFILPSFRNSSNVHHIFSSSSMLIISSPSFFFKTSLSFAISFILQCLVTCVPLHPDDLLLALLLLHCKLIDPKKFMKPSIICWFFALTLALVRGGREISDRSCC